MPADRIDSVVSLAKRRGFVFPSSEIYGGTRSAWDYGPLGVELKENVRRQWWRTMVQQRDDIVGLDSAVILAREVWEASGHIDEFVDPLTECQSCHKRFRADHLEEAFEAKHGRAADVARRAQLPQLRQQGHLHRAEDVQRPDEDLPRPGRERRGPALPAARRPRRASSSTTTTSTTAARKKPPFGIAQIGKSFRNEITPGNFIFRTREFEQMEMEFFVEPGTDEEWHEYWLQQRWNWYLDLGLSREQPALLRAPEGEAVALLQAHGRHRVPLPVRRHRVLRARGHRQPHRLRPDHALQALRRRPVLLRPGEGASAGCRTSSSRRPV